MARQNLLAEPRTIARDALHSGQLEKIECALANIESLLHSGTMTKKKRASLKGMRQSLQQAFAYSKKSEPEKVLGEALAEILRARLLAERLGVSIDDLIIQVGNHIRAASELVNSLTEQDMQQLNGQMIKFVSEKAAAEADLIRLRIQLANARLLRDKGKRSVKQRPWIRFKRSWATRN